MTTDNVCSVYSGKANRCCCGCSGKHYTNPKHKDEADHDRGYELENCNARMVTKVLRLLQANEDSCRLERGSHAALELGARLYVAYFTNEFKSSLMQG